MQVGDKVVVVDHTQGYSGKYNVGDIGIIGRVKDSQCQMKDEVGSGSTWHYMSKLELVEAKEEDRKYTFNCMHPEAIRWEDIPVTAQDPYAVVRVDNKLNVVIFDDLIYSAKYRKGGTKIVKKIYLLLDDSYDSWKGNFNVWKDVPGDTVTEVTKLVRALKHAPWKKGKERKVTVHVVKV